MWRVYAACAIATLFVANVVPAHGQSRVRARTPGQKMTLSELRALAPSDQVVVKFREGRRIRLSGQRTTGMTSSEANALATALREAHVPSDSVTRLHARPESELDAERRTAQRRSGRRLPDLNLYYVIKLPAGVSAAEVANRLNALSFVDFAEPAARPSPPPQDGGPAADSEAAAPPPPAASPDLTNFQNYKGPAPGGIGVLNPSIPGSDGKGISFADVEYSWHLDHEDLQLPVSHVIDVGAPFKDPFGSRYDHGTAVLGVLVGKRNSFGVTGIAPASFAMLAPMNTTSGGYNPANAISAATAKLSLGDVMIIEAQNRGCGGNCGEDQVGCTPLEALPYVYDAIAAATAKGVIVVAAAGNGNVNLDGPKCNGLFDRSKRDSQAIIVGAGSSTNRSRMNFSNYGSRVDVQGWGEKVTTTGYGDAFNPSTQRYYTKLFGGTSSATPIVAGAVLAIQGVLKACGLPPLTPLRMRDFLTKTGTPQGKPASGRIGPLPRIRAVLDAAGVPPRCLAAGQTAMNSSIEAAPLTYFRERGDQEKRAGRSGPRRRMQRD